MTVSALDCVGRAAKSVRANWQLILTTWVGGLVATMLILLGLAPPLWLVGRETGQVVEQQHWLRLARATWDRLLDLSPAMLGAMVATLFLWLLACVVYCFFHAGLYGVLVSAERQTGTTPAARWMLFRAFDWQHFCGWGRRYLWRFFWFFNLFLAVATSVSLLLAIWMVLAVIGADRWGESATLTIGCGGALPLALLLLVLTAWFFLGQAHLARERSGVWKASAVALRVIARRLGAVTLIVVLFVAVAVVLGAMFVPLVLVVDLTLAGGGMLYRLVSSFLVQSIAESVWTLLLAASLVALLQAELRVEEVA